jgi:hypothetical protein
VLPRPTDQWQCPVLLILWSGVPFEDLPADGMRWAISSVMNKVEAPEVSKEPMSLLNRWDRLDKSQEALPAKPYTITWLTYREQVAR